MRRGSQGRSGPETGAKRRAERDGGTPEDRLPIQIRRRRGERGLSRAELAALTGYSRSYIGQLEQPSRGIPARRVIEAVDEALAAGGALIRLRDAAKAARAERMGRGPDPETESRRRIGNLLDQRSSDHELDHLDRLAAELIARADALDPPDVTARVLDQQAYVDHLLRTPMLPHQQFRLFMIAGHLAGLLAISLLDVDELAKASTCCLEAAVFTELTGHEGLRAWTLAVNSLIDAAARHAEARTERPAEGDADPAGGRWPSHGPTAQHREDHDHGFSGYADIAVATPFGETTDAPGSRPTSPSGSRDATEPPYDEVVGTGIEDEMRSHPVSGTGSGYGRPANLDELLIAPGGRATPPRLIALVKGRIARFTTTSAHRATPPSGISRAFRPPV